MYKKSGWWCRIFAFWGLSKMIRSNKCKPRIESMKTTTILTVCAALLFGFSACSSDEDTDLEFQEPDNSVPEFNGDSFINPKGDEVTTTTVNGIEIRKDGYGTIRWISFLDCPNPPSTAQEMFRQFMGIELDGNFELYRHETTTITPDPLTLECYYQVYKGVALPAEGYNVRLQNGKVTSCNGSSIKINDLDVQPAFGLKKAREIYAKYLGVSPEQISEKGIGPWIEDPLIIMNLPTKRGSSEWAPRLVYTFFFNGLSDEGICYIDAHTGRILLTEPNYMNIGY